MKPIYLLFLTLCCACIQKTETTTFQIKTVDATNQDAPFYVLFKATDFSQFLTDDYKKIAHQKMLSKEDPDFLDSAFFVPGDTKTIAIENPENKGIGVYFIFKHPGEEWKYLAQEGGKRRIKILTGENEIKSISAF